MNEPIPKNIRTFSEFWPYYVREHVHPVSRTLHVIGTAGVLTILVYALVVGPLWLLLFLPVFGYAFAWAGHFFFQRNKPATFSYPLFSLAGDFVMFFKVVTGGMKRELEENRQKINK